MANNIECTNSGVDCATQVGRAIINQKVLGAT